MASRAAARKAAKPIPTFRDIAQIVIEAAKRRSTNAKVRYQWERHLGEAYSGPLLDRPVSEITTVDVAAVLKPIWIANPEVARKHYPAVRRVFEYARIRLRDDHGMASSRFIDRGPHAASVKTRMPIPRASASQNRAEVARQRRLQT